MAEEKYIDRKIGELRKETQYSAAQEQMPTVRFQEGAKTGAWTRRVTQSDGSTNRRMMG